jgi:hypothetical protein
LDKKPLPFSLLMTSSLSKSLASELFDLAIDISKAPYCTIILYQKSPNDFVENVKAGLVTNLIWVPIVFIFEILFAALAYWIWTKFNVNIYEWGAPLVIPTITPTP